MTPESLEVLDALVIASTTELLAAYGVHATYTGATSATALPNSATIAGMIGFSGDEVRGALLLASSEAFFARTTPRNEDGHDAGPEATRAWAAELANQLLGRLKNHLYAYGVVFSASTPTALSGAALGIASPTTQHARGYAFQSEDTGVWVRVDVIGEELSKQRDDGAKAAREGDLLLF